jgi:pimeloyl-ACP methyl ester carboxylesterase
MAGAADGVRHRTVEANGVRLHVAEAGPEGAAAPVVLLLHGFPDLWYGWRHQMAALAARGYRAVAPDLRGYGDSDAPPDASAYTTFHVVGDLVALIADLGQPQVFAASGCINQSVRFLAPRKLRGNYYLMFDFFLSLFWIGFLCSRQVFVVGHDWGAIVAWQLCLLRPDLVRALVNLSVVYHPRRPEGSPLQGIKAVCGEDHYMCRFQVTSGVLCFRFECLLVPGSSFQESIAFIYDEY